jgi:hypothetical protein
MRYRISTALAALLLGACSAAPSTAPSSSQPATIVPASATVLPTIEPAPTATPTPSASASPTAAATAAAGVRTLTASKTTALTPGTYTRSDFKPKITFKVASGSWYCVQLVAGFFDVEQQVGSPDVIAVQFARPQEVYTTGGFGIVAADAQTAATLLQANTGLKTLDSSQSKIAGLSGYQLTIENGGSTDAKVMRLPAGTLAIAPDRRLRITFLDTPDGLLAVMVGGSVGKWDVALSAAGPIVSSITIAK